MATGFRRLAMASLAIVCASVLFTARAYGSTITVTSTADEGPGSLRQAIADAVPYDLIVLDVTGTISLTNGPLVVTKDNLTIAGPGASALAIDAQHASRVFEIGTAWAPVHAGISGVTLRNGTAPDGGGILNDGVLGLVGVVLSGHTALNEGGAILNRGALSLLDTLVTANTAWIGGGISNRAGVVSIYRSTISGNTADGLYGGMGGGIASAQGGYGGSPDVDTLTIRDSVISGNRASLRGGAIYNASGLLTILNSTVAANTCTYIGPSGPCLCAGGGGVYNSTGSVRITASTLAGNSALTAGGAITSLYGRITVTASILATGASGPNCYAGAYGRISSEGFNLSDDASCAGAFTAYGDRNDIAAGLSPMGLENNGGQTATIQLLPTSPAVDALPVCLGADQRGVARPQGPACDIGAYERISSPYSADVQMPIRADGTAVFSANRGVVPVKFVLTLDGAPTCALPPATIRVARVGGDSSGPLIDSTYELPADEGHDFRVDAASCGYVYNLATTAFTAGSYWVAISIDGEVVGYATFRIR